MSRTLFFKTIHCLLRVIYLINYLKAAHIPNSTQKALILTNENTILYFKRYIFLCPKSKKKKKPRIRLLKKGVKPISIIYF